ncbi:MAG TPA: methyl-accepting chemotaxis protein [Burkholderiaceae bacterium]|nr:methyl-accepting chemotaxis protein [Burkholderiaceae bacterium]
MNTMSIDQPVGMKAAGTQPDGRKSAGRNWSFLARLKLWQKFALLGAIVVAIAAVPLFALYQGMQERIELVRTEQAGVTSVTMALDMVKKLQDHRGTASYFVQRDAKLSADQPKHLNNADQALAALRGRLGGLGQPDIDKRLDTLEKSWAQIKSDVTGYRIDQRSVIAVHTEAISEVFRLIGDLSAFYKLDLIPEADTHYLIRGTLLELPVVSEAVGQLRAPVVSRLKDLADLRAACLGGKVPNLDAAMREAFSPTDRALAARRADNLELALERYLASMRKASAASPEIAAAASEELANVQRSTEQAIELVRREVLGKAFPTIDPNVYLEQMTVPRVAIQKLATQQELVEQHLQRRLDETRADALKTVGGALGLLLVAGAIAFAIATLIVRNITGTVRTLQASVEKVRGGDFDALQDIRAQDEVGDLGRTVNSLLQERIAAQRAAEEENERLNNSVISILQAVNQLSQRDLTVRAPVTQDVVGTVSDSINLLTDETSKVLVDVHRIADQLAQVSGKVRSRAELVSKTAQVERHSVGQMIESLSEATKTMGQMTALAEQSNQDAAQATQVTDTALETVNSTVKGMNSIRETIAETEKRIKRLGERSQEITGIVNLINTISERTHVLALNASMQAAVAGEAGRGFAVVAEEVQRLAESSRNATQQIGTLVSNIQLETNETIATVNRTIGQVVEGSELAQKAGEQMRRTQEITAQLVAQVGRIAESSEVHKAMSANLLQAVQRIGQSTERTAQQIDAQNQETETLLSSARRLVESVGVFKLPQAA